MTVGSSTITDLGLIYSNTKELRWGPSGPFFLSLPVLLRWPDELGREQNELVGIDQIAAMCDVINTVAGIIFAHAFGDRW